MNIQKVTESGMEIGAVQSVQSRPAAAQAQPQIAATDTISISQNAGKVAGYVNSVQAEPQVRADKVAAFQPQVSSGNYPPPALIEGISRLLGNAASPKD